MLQWIKDVNAYVEEQSRYQTDNVILELDEGTFQVTVYPADEYGTAVAGSSPIVDVTLSDLTTAINFYNQIAQQLHEGDVIRHYNNPAQQVTDPYTESNSRYSNF